MSYLAQVTRPTMCCGSDQGKGTVITVNKLFSSDGGMVCGYCHRPVLPGEVVAQFGKTGNVQAYRLDTITTPRDFVPGDLESDPIISVEA